MKPVEKILKPVVETQESPDYVRLSLAAAMTLGLRNGLFYRNAKLFCINLLLTYADGCLAKCAYCGLSGNRPGTYDKKSFIRVAWPTHPLYELIERIGQRKNSVNRICISMITRKRAVEHTKTICGRLRSGIDIPVSLLVAPTVLSESDFEDFKAEGADKIGVAIDLATSELFEKFRGAGVGGPHQWEKYWKSLEKAMNVFGPQNVGAHFMVGMGETDQEMCESIQRLSDMGGQTHLFSFFPEVGSKMSDADPPPMAKYRRIQLARYLIDNHLAFYERFIYDEDGQIIHFGLSDKRLNDVINSGEPFRTSGCTGYNGEVACNRPFANSRPGPDIRNYPFQPTPKDISRIKVQLKYSNL